MASLPMMNRFRRFQPRTEAADEYSTHTDMLPDQADYAPSFWKKLGAGLTGALAGLKDPSAGLQLSESILTAPYKQALSRHQQIGKSLYEKAKLEQEANEVGRLAANDELDAETAWMTQENANRRYEAAVEQRREAAKMRADAQAAETDRRSKADALLAAHRARMAKVAEQNAGTASARGKAYQEFVGKYGNKPKDTSVSPLDQKRIRQMAVVEAKKDPKFSKIPVFDDGSYDTSKADPRAAQEFEQLIQMYEHQIANRKKNDYTNPSIMDSDFDFERNLQDEDDDEDFWDFR